MRDTVSRADAARKFHVTFFQDEQARTIERADLTLAELRKRIASAHAPTREELPWLELGRFGDVRTPPPKRCFRHKRNLQSVSGIECDYDGKQISFEVGVATLTKAKLCGVAYETSSSTTAAPKWRWILPLSQEYDPSHRETFVARAHGLMGGAFAPESFTLSQAYLFGSIGDKPSHRVVMLKGQYIDKRADLDEGAMHKNMAKQLRAIDGETAGAGGVPDKASAYLRAAAARNFNLPMDVTKRLADMIYDPKGETGDNGVHQTQLSVLASLAASREDEDAAVEKVLEATRKAIGETEAATWNWIEEDERVRAMWADWLSKHPEHKPRSTAKGSTKAKEPPGGVRATKVAAKVADLGAARAEKQAKAKPEPEAGAAPRKLGKKERAQIQQILGDGFLDELKKRGEDILVSKKQVWRCVDNIWTLLPTPDDISDWMNRELELGCRVLNTPSTTKIINEAKAFIRRSPRLYARGAFEWDAHGKIPTLSGLVDPMTGKVEALTPKHYATYRIDCKYAPEKQCPVWDQMVKDCFPDDPETQALLQELIGVALLERKPRELMKALVLVGPSNSGKSNLLNVAARLISNNPISTPIAQLDLPHGTVEFVRRAPWLLHEAFEQSRWDKSAMVKALLSGDHFSVNHKGSIQHTQQYHSPVFWGANSQPQFREASKAMINRMVLINCDIVFDEDNLIGAAAKARKSGDHSPADLVLRTEKSGILNYALAGLRGAMKRGHFILPEKSKASLKEIRDKANFVLAFNEECTERAHKMLWLADYKLAYDMWWEENRSEKAPSPDQIGTALRDLHDSGYRFGKTGAHRYIVGMKLNDAGMEFWERANKASYFAGSTTAASSSAAEVERQPPK